MNGVIVAVLHQTGQSRATGWLRFFNFDSESNLPTWFSVFLLLTAAWHLWQLSRHEPPKRTFWRILAGVFAFLGVDELGQVHEKFNSVGRTWVGYEEGAGSGIWHHAWTLPYLLLFAVLGLFLVPQFLRLPRRWLLRFALAAVLFLTGAVLVEMLSGVFLSDNLRTGSTKDTFYYLMTTLEESLEMLGVIYFIYQLRRYRTALLPSAASSAE